MLRIGSGDGAIVGDIGAGEVAHDFTCDPATRGVDADLADRLGIGRDSGRMPLEPRSRYSSLVRRASVSRSWTTREKLYAPIVKIATTATTAATTAAR
jgi:hypothetical protein